MSTPMQQQYDELKKKYPDTILLFRLGDFYECFNDDAKKISQILNIVLTSRGKNEAKRPMAGIPYHALSNYLPKLINSGLKVAIAEQLEEPQKGKTLVAREVTRIVSKGTITDENFLDSSRNNFISSVIIQKDKGKIGFAFCDLSTGEFLIKEIFCQKEKVEENAIAQCKKFAPSEILSDINFFQNKINARFEQIDTKYISFEESNDFLCNHFKVANLKGFGINKFSVAIIAAASLLKYIKDDQKNEVFHIKKIKVIEDEDFVSLDENSIEKLELISSNGVVNTSLISIIDDCKTGIGKRMLFSWLINPLKNVEKINLRLDAVQELFENSDKRKKIRKILSKIYDIERIAGKIGNCSASPKDFIALKNSLVLIKQIANESASLQSILIREILNKIDLGNSGEEMIKIIDSAIEEDAPVQTNFGGIIKAGYDKELDEYKSEVTKSKEWIKNLQSEEIKRTGINSLKVKFNKIFGYFIEISKTNISKVPSNYIRKQTLFNCERFITKELKQKEELILNSEQMMIEKEKKIFEQIRQSFLKYIELLQDCSVGIGQIDVISNFSEIAEKFNYRKPKIEKGKLKQIVIKNGRHPVVEKLIKDDFIANDVILNDQSYLHIITGPNMAGKSTFIRQVAVNVIMAQIGCFVAADEMILSPVDKIFARIGAGDSIARGESTFLVEMTETANILNNATRNSLIILDEVGRGTSTYDGVAIAWAVCEYIHENIKAKTLFATHYHELIEIEKELNGAKIFNSQVLDKDGKIIFLRKIVKGGTNKSYGIHVAELAGVPEQVCRRAHEILNSLNEKSNFKNKKLNKSKSVVIQRMLPFPTLPEDPLISKLRKIDTDNITPFDALKILKEIQSDIKKRK